MAFAGILIMKYKYYIYNMDNSPVVWRTEKNGQTMCFGPMPIDEDFLSSMSDNSLANNSYSPYIRRITVAEVKALFPHAYAK